VQIQLSLQGGLGNQLFQWALASSLSTKGAAVTLDSVRLRGVRPLALGQLARRFDSAPRWRSLVLAGVHRIGLTTGRHLPGFVVESEFGYDSDLEHRLRRWTYLMEYFQSFRYFSEISADVRRAVSAAVADDLTDRGRALRERVASHPRAVAVHVRRGD